MSTQHDFLTSSFLRVVDAFQLATGWGESTVSHYLFGHGKRLRQIRDGERMLRADTMALALQIMSNDWPLDAEIDWPRDVSRPLRVVSPSRARQPA